MRLRSSGLLLIVMIAICSSRYGVCAQQAEGVRSHVLHAIGNRTCFFADEEARIAYVTTARPKNDEQPISWNVQWSLSSGNRTISRGTSRTKVLADAGLLRFVVEIPMPALRDEVALPIQLSIHWNDGQTTHQRTRQIHLFARETFTHHQKLLENAEIALFDPENRTAELLDEQEIPFARLGDLAAVDLVAEGVLLVGDGVSFREQRKLGESLLQAAQRGVSVLCLAPSEGDFPYPASQEQAIQPTTLSLEREDIVRRYDKRFDLLPSVSRLGMVTRRNQVAFSVTHNQSGWPWLEMQFPNQRADMPAGRLVFCGLGLVSEWANSPVPRYLFLRILEEFTATQPVLEKSNEIIQR